MTSGRLERIILGSSIPPVLGGFIFHVYMSIINTTPSYSPEYAESPITHFIAGIFFVPIISLVLFGIQSLLYSLLMEFVVQKIGSDTLVIIFSMLLGALVASLLGSETGIIGGVVGLIVGYYLRKYIKLEQANKEINKDT